MAHPHKEEAPANVDRDPDLNRRQAIRFDANTTPTGYQGQRLHVQRPIEDRYVTIARRWIAAIRAERGGQS